MYFQQPCRLPKRSGDHPCRAEYTTGPLATLTGILKKPGSPHKSAVRWQLHRHTRPNNLRLSAVRLPYKPFLPHRNSCGKPDPKAGGNFLAKSGTQLCMHARPRDNPLQQSGTSPYTVAHTARKRARHRCIPGTTGSSHTPYGLPLWRLHMWSSNNSVKPLVLVFCSFSLRSRIAAYTPDLRLPSAGSSRRPASRGRQNFPNPILVCRGPLYLCRVPRPPMHTRQRAQTRSFAETSLPSSAFACPSMSLLTTTQTASTHSSPAQVEFATALASPSLPPTMQRLDTLLRSFLLLVAPLLRRAS